jgi:ABC-2 type transport system permease protein
VVVLPALFNRGRDDVEVGVVGGASPVEPALLQAARAAGATVSVQRYADEAAARAAVEAGESEAVFLSADRVLVDESLEGRGSCWPAR